MLSAPFLLPGRNFWDLKNFESPSASDFFRSRTDALLERAETSATFDQDKNLRAVFWGFQKKMRE